ncbi:MAG: sugar O-acetyltransferase [Acidobacteriaceae bacterium]
MSEPDQRSERERRIAGDLYRADDPELQRELLRAAELMFEYNHSGPDNVAVRQRILSELMGSVGPGTEIRPPLYCDYGYNIRIGARTFVNYGLVALDVATITIGEDVQIGPNVQLLTATHPVDPESRRQKWEYARPIRIGNNVWIGAGAIVCPGVTIDENSVIGAGAVVVRNLPRNVVAAGNPARVIRQIQE